MKKSIFISAAVLFAGYKLLSNAGVERIFETSDSVNLYTKTAGKGDVCIYLHGGPGAWSKSFERLGGSKLESFMKMIYLDQRGCGRSEKAWNKDYSLDRMMKDIDELIEYSGQKKVYLLAHSFGGVLATNYAIRYPEKIKGLILTTATLNTTQSIQAQLKYINSLLDTRFEADEPDDLKPAFQAAFRELNKKKLRYKMLTDNLRTYNKLVRIDTSEQTKHDFAVRVWNYPEYSNDLKTETAKIDIPVLVINGNRDTSIGENPESMFNFPKSENYTIDGGHLLYYEQNKDFVGLVKQFVNKIDLECF